jgi:type VI secretion system secreted protein Hcp
MLWDAPQARSYGPRRIGQQGADGMAIYAKIKGATQGDLAGAVTADGFKGQIQVNSVVFGVGSPHDVATGRPSGRRVARPVKITKPFDRSSPLLHRSAVTNESLTTVEISYVVEGQGHKSYATLTLTNAMIQDFQNEASFTGVAVESISLTYTKVEFTWKDGGITSTDDWSSS